jgi:hypothetical protein
VCEKRLPREILGSRRYEVTGDWRGCDLDVDGSAWTGCVWLRIDTSVGAGLVNLVMNLRVPVGPG